MKPTRIEFYIQYATIAFLIGACLVSANAVGIDCESRHCSLLSHFWHEYIKCLFIF